jgi:hypothetical protein
MALGAAPDGDPPVVIPTSRGAVGFYVTLVHRLGSELSLHHCVSLFETLFLVTHFKDKMTGNVGWGAMIVVIFQSASPEELALGMEQPVMENR